MTLSIQESTTVRELVGRYSATRRVFENYGIDYCCGGGATLAQAATASRIELSELIAALEASQDRLTTATASEEKDWYAAPLRELIQHIVQVHHAYLKRALPMLEDKLKKVLRAHGTEHGPMLRRLHSVFDELSTELSMHLMKEEEILFPYVYAAEAHRQGEAERPSACFPAVNSPIRQMEAEHETAGRALEEIRAITAGYTPPEDACVTFCALYDDLKHLEQDLHQHIHLENNILFPRAIEAESASSPTNVTFAAVAPR